MSRHGEAIGLLWEVAQSQRTMLTEDGSKMLVVMSQDLLDRIDDFIGFDEMGQ